MSKSKVDELNQQVTLAVRLAESLEDEKSPHTREAFALLSLTEQHLAEELPRMSDEWKIAWRGAVRAAAKAGDGQRAAWLKIHLSINLGVFDNQFFKELDAVSESTLEPFRP